MEWEPVGQCGQPLSTAATQSWCLETWGTFSEVLFSLWLLLYIREAWACKNIHEMAPEEESMWGLEDKSHLKAGLQEAGCRDS